MVKSVGRRRGGSCQDLDCGLVLRIALFGDFSAFFAPAVFFAQFSGPTFFRFMDKNQDDRRFVALLSNSLRIPRLFFQSSTVASMVWLSLRPKTPSHTLFQTFLSGVLGFLFFWWVFLGVPFFLGVGVFFFFCCWAARTISLFVCICGR